MAFCIGAVRHAQRFYKLQHYNIDFTFYLVKCVRKFIEPRKSENRNNNKTTEENWNGMVNKNNNERVSSKIALNINKVITK